MVQAQQAPAFRVGLVVNMPEIEAAKIGKAFTRALGLGCAAVPCRSYTELLERVEDCRVELAWLPPVAYLRAEAAAAVKLLLTVERGGRDTFSSALLGRRAVISGFGDLPGKRAAWVHVWSAAGYLLPRYMLRANGLDPDSTFAAQGFYESHSAVLSALQDGSADVGAAFCAVGDDGEIERHPWTAEHGVTVLATSFSIPTDTICAARHVPDDLAKTITDLLLQPQRGAVVAKALEGSGLGPAEPSRYSRLAEVLAADFQT